MTVKECYDEMGGSYDDVLARLMTDKRIEKYLGKFLKDTSYTELCAALEAQDWAGGFAASHNLKGVCLNLGISRLGGSASELCESLRGGSPSGNTAALLAAVKEDYARSTAAISRLLDAE